MSIEKENRVIIDTNLFISFLIGKKLKTLKEQIINLRVRLLFSEPTIKEIDLVTKKPKLQKYFNPSDVSDLIDFIQLIGEFVIIKNEPDICRDPKDNFLLGLSESGKADYLVTGDSDLIILKHYKQTKIITYSEFENILAKMGTKA
ncbi:MAG: putative toxin-antitoxin system toxin component, PIN family [Bacteroidia bacterium]|nr:putative toxin-antitoxin system toxin component, PIN family [Bacteroidia bacterium]